MSSKSGGEQSKSSSKWKSFIFAVFLAALCIRSFLFPATEFGDGREYILQAQSIVFDGALAIDPVERGVYWNATNPFGVTLDSAPGKAPPEGFALREGAQYGGGFGSLYPARDGTWRYVHPWVYSAAVAPFYAVLHSLFSGGPSEYQAFRLANVIFIVVPLVLLWRRNPTTVTLAFFGVLFASPITPHIQWAHTELFCFGCVLTAFALIDSQRLGRWSPLFLGLGAAQNLPIVVFLPLHFFLRRSILNKQHGFSFRSLFCGVVPYVAAAVLPLGIALQVHSLFGAFTLIPALGQASLQNVTLRRMLSVFFSPQIGCFVYFPAAWVAIMLAIAAKKTKEAAITLFFVLAAAAMSSTTANINSAQLSACRYAVWYLAPLYMLPFYSGAPLRMLRQRGMAGLAVGVGCLAGLFLWWLGTYKFLAGEWHLFFSNNRARPEVAALYRWSHFHDDPEPLVENLTGSELRAAHQFSGVYVWNLGKEQSLWVVSKRAHKKNISIKVQFHNPSYLVRPGLEQLFDVDESGDEEHSLVLTPAHGVHFSTHPVWGGYKFLWVAAAVESAVSQQQVVIK